DGEEITEDGNRANDAVDQQIQAHSGDDDTRHFHRVTLVWLDLGQCGDAACDGPDFPAGTFALGPVTLITAEPTTTLRRTWAQVKQTYR
ncbi:MAG: hypothetical protein ABL977_11390, partial [Candidatus Eisenbacteria bacterium]